MSRQSSADVDPSVPAAASCGPRVAARAKAEVSCFHVVAEAHPGTIGRLIEVVAKRGMVPSYLHGVVGGRRGDELAVDLQVAGLDGAARDLVAAQLRALVPVRAVLTSVKSFAD